MLLYFHIKNSALTINIISSCLKYLHACVFMTKILAYPIFLLRPCAKLALSALASENRIIGTVKGLHSSKKNNRYWVLKYQLFKTGL